MGQRRITDAEIRRAILSAAAEVIEDYPADKYSPSCLIYGVTEDNRVLHVQANEMGVIVTVYDPDPDQWIDFKRRRLP
jgi:hypothetical protein